MKNLLLLKDLRVTVMGLGLHGGGLGAARFLIGQGARVTITDLLPPERLAPTLAGLRHLPLADLRLGEHRAEQFTQADLVVVNPAVPPDNPWLALAQQAGTRLTSEIELFLERCPAPVVAITGSNGKSTTCGLLAAMLRETFSDGGERRVFLGGNVGGSLLDDLPRIRAADWVVLELSSFQLERLPLSAPWPHGAIVTNFAPNHLNWHGSLPAYAAAKQKLLRGAPADGFAVLNPQEEGLQNWTTLTAARCLEPRFDLAPPEVFDRRPDEDTEHGGGRLWGAHQRRNAALAAAAALAIGCGPSEIVRAVRNFRGLPHRLEFVGRDRGRACYNDSKATTPEATAAALAACGPRTWLLAGGVDKGGDFGSLLARLPERAAGVAFFGQAGAALADRTRALHSEFPCVRCETLAEAWAWCLGQSTQGDTILLSPACASFDQFRDFEERGAAFRELVRASGIGL